MEIIRPVSSLELGFTVETTVTTGTTLSPYDDFETAVSWWAYRGDRVFSNPADGGDGGNYELIVRILHVGVWSSRPENDRYNWRLLDYGTVQSEIFNVEDYLTDAKTSTQTLWTSGEALVAGARRHFRGRDYELLEDVTTAENVLSPLAAVTTSGADYSNRWLDLGPSNAFRMLDDEVATATAFEPDDASTPGEWNTTLRARGSADRLALWSMAAVAGVSVEVTAGEIFANPEFDNEKSDLLVFPNVSTSWASSAWTMTNDDYLTDGSGGDYPAAAGWAWAIRSLDFLTVGKTYRFSVTVTAVTGTTPQWRLVATTPGESGTSLAATSLQTGTGTVYLDFTPTDDAAAVWVQMTSTTQSITFSSISLKQQGYAGETLTKTLQSAPGGLCRRHAILHHTLVTCPQYVLTLAATDASRTAYLGLVSAGRAVEIGVTLADVDVGNESFSRLAEDQYGVARKVRKRNMRRIRAIVWLDSVAGAQVDQQLHELEGTDFTIDFNNSGGDDARLQVHGWPESWGTVVTGISELDTLQITMRSLVEAIRV
jgi:hypothetical protein